MNMPKIVEVGFVGDDIYVTVEWGYLWYTYRIESEKFDEEVVGVENDEEPMFFTVQFASEKKKTVAMFVPGEDPYIDFYDFDTISYIGGESVNFTMMYE